MRVLGYRIRVGVADAAQEGHVVGGLHASQNIRLAVGLDDKGQQNLVRWDIKSDYAIFVEVVELIECLAESIEWLPQKTSKSAG